METPFLSVFVLFSLSDLIYLQLLLFSHPCLVTELKLSEDMTHKSLPLLLFNTGCGSCSRSNAVRTVPPKIPSVASSLFSSFGLVRVALFLFHTPIVALLIPDLVMKPLGFINSFSERIQSSHLRTWVASTL